MMAQDSEKPEISVLYVDDEKALLDVGKIYMEKFGDISVTTADSAYGGFSLLENGTFDCIISDYQMPGMDGIEFLKNLRGEGNTTPFILFTGKGREEVVIEAVNNGADFYIQKGGEPRSQFTELLNAIKRSISAKEAGRKLLKSEKKYRTLVDYSPNFIYSYDTDNRFTSANSTLCRFLGLTEDEIIGKRYEELGFPGDTYKYLYKLHEKVFETRDVVRAESSIKMPDGNEYHYKVVFVPILDETGSVTGIRGNSADITDKIIAEKNLIEKNSSLHQLNESLAAAEEELRQQMSEIASGHHSLIETNQYMENLFNNSASCVIVWDDNFVITKANGAAEKLAGVSGGGLCNLMLDDLLNTEKRLELSEKINALGPGEHIEGFETRIKTPSGDVKTVRWDVAKICDYTGKHVATTAQGQDITKMYEYQGRLQEKHDKILAANEMIAAAEEELRQQMDEIAKAHRVIRQSEKRLYDIVNLLPDPAFAVDSRGEIIMWNAAMSEIYGYSSRDMIGKCNREYSRAIYGYERPALVDLIQNYDEEFVKENYRSCSLKDGRVEGYVSLKSPDCKDMTLWCIAGLLYDDEGDIAGAIETFRDVTHIENNTKKLEVKNEELLAAEEEIRQQMDEIAKAQHSLDETNQYMENLFFSSASCVIVWDNNFVITKANEAAEKLAGLSKGGLCNLMLDDLFTCEKRLELSEKLKSTDSNEHIEGFETTVETPAGNIKTVRWDVAKVIDYNGRHTATIAQGQDITEIRSYEDQITESNRKLSQKNRDFEAVQNELYHANHQLRLMTGITRHDVLNSIMAAEGFLELMEDAGEDEQKDYLKKLSEIVVKVRKQIEFTRKTEKICSNVSVWQNLYEMVKDLEGPQDIDLKFGDFGVEILAGDMLRKVFENLLDNTCRHGGDKVSLIEAECLVTPENRLHIMWQDNGYGIPDDEKEKIFEDGYGTNTGLGLAFMREYLEISGIAISESGIYGEGARFVIDVPPERYRIMRDN